MILRLWTIVGLVSSWYDFNVVDHCRDTRTSNIQCIIYVYDYCVHPIQCLHGADAHFPSV